MKEMTPEQLAEEIMPWKPGEAVGICAPSDVREKIAKIIRDVEKRTWEAAVKITDAAAAAATAEELATLLLAKTCGESSCGECNELRDAAADMLRTQAQRIAELEAELRESRKVENNLSKENRDAF